MKKTVTDLQDIRVELDAEDKELMAMFPVSRRAVINDMQLVMRRNGRMYLENKAFAARKRKIIRCILLGYDGALAALLLALAIAYGIRGGGHPIALLIGFEVTLVPFLMQIPAGIRR